jgi:hypothetical protein
VHGIDIAADTQIAGETRITAHLCDASNGGQVATVLKAIAPLVPDIIIDDGLHSASAQIATLRNFFPALRASGLYVVEDVIPSNVPAILCEIERIDPGCDFFVDMSLGECVAIVIRKTTPGEKRGRASEWIGPANPDPVSSILTKRVSMAVPERLRDA